MASGYNSVTPNHNAKYYTGVYTKATNDYKNSLASDLKNKFEKQILAAANNRKTSVEIKNLTKSEIEFFEENFEKDNAKARFVIKKKPVGYVSGQENNPQYSITIS